jgi:phosphatidate phosphatase APP1
MKTKIFITLLIMLSFSKVYSQNEEFTYVTTSTNGEGYSVLIKKIDEYSTEIWVKKTEPIKSKKIEAEK